MKPSESFGPKWSLSFLNSYSISGLELNWHIEYCPVFTYLFMEPVLPPVPLTLDSIFLVGKDHVSKDYLYGPACPA